MTDVISINRQFLIMAREAANAKSGEVLTGLPRPVLDKLAAMPIDEIEAVARQAGTSLISLRLTETEINRLVALDSSARGAYILSVVAGNDR